MQLRRIAWQAAKAFTRHWTGAFRRILARVCREALERLQRAECTGGSKLGCILFFIFSAGIWAIFSLEKKPFLQNLPRVNTGQLPCASLHAEDMKWAWAFRPDVSLTTTRKNEFFDFWKPILQMVFVYCWEGLEANILRRLNRLGILLVRMLRIAASAYKYSAFTGYARERSDSEWV